MRQCEQDQGVGTWWEDLDAGLEDLEGPDLEDIDSHEYEDI